MLLVALGVGVALLRPTALKLASILLVASAILLPIGVLNPFAEMDRIPHHFYPPGFEDNQIAPVLVAMSAAVVLAHFIGVARIQQVGRKADSAGVVDPKA